jgi:hypothetical protein
MIESNPATHHQPTHPRSVMCGLEEECDTLSAGHSLSFMRRRLAAATSTKWIDATVTDVATDGRITVTALADADELVLWNHADVSGMLRAGDPVAFHSVYGVLAVGSTWLNAAVAAF